MPSYRDLGRILEAAKEDIWRLTRERDEARAEVEQLNLECNALAHQLNRCNERGGQMRRLLVWAEALIRSLSGWPETHPNEVVEWKEDWRKVREGE